MLVLGHPGYGLGWVWVNPYKIKCCWCFCSWARWYSVISPEWGCVVGGGGSTTIKPPYAPSWARGIFIGKSVGTGGGEETTCVNVTPVDAGMVWVLTNGAENSEVTRATGFEQDVTRDEQVGVTALVTWNGSKQVRQLDAYSKIKKLK